MTDPIKLAREALEFYANPHGYEETYTALPCECCTDISGGECLADEGERARTALAALDAIPQPAPVPGDAELDELRQDIIFECVNSEIDRLLAGRVLVALSALRTRLAEVEQQRDTAVRIGAEHMARGDRLERELATALAGAVKARAEGRKAGLAEAAEYLQQESANYPDNVAWCVQDDAKAIPALAAQTEEASDD